MFLPRTTKTNPLIENTRDNICLDFETTRLCFNNKIVLASVKIRSKKSVFNSFEKDNCVLFNDNTTHNSFVPIIQFLIIKT